MFNVKKFAYFQMVYPKIIETLRLVAAPPEVQLTAFPAVVYPPDEIADFVEAAVLMAREILEIDYLTQEQFDSITLIESAFQAFSMEEWEVEALRESESWEETRRLARQALDSLSVEYAKPNIYWYAILNEPMKS